MRPSNNNNWTQVVHSWRDVSVSDVTMVLLTDVIFFLIDANQKLNFYSQDNKVSYMYLLVILLLVINCLSIMHSFVFSHAALNRKASLLDSRSHRNC